MIDKFSCGFINSVYKFNDYTLNELICKLAQKMDEVITQSNESFNYLNWLKEQGLSDEVINILTKWKDDGTFNTIINNNLFNELNNIINENKLQIDNKINEVNTQLDEKVNVNDLETTNKRIDNLIIHSGEGTVNNAEVVDGIAGIDGTSYSLIGDNIRATSNNVYSFISNAFDFKNETITNLLNVNNMTVGKMIDANGNEVVQSGCSYTNDYLFLKGGESITLNFATYFTIVRYTTNKTFVANIVVNNEDLPYVYTADSDMYLKFNVYNDNKSSAMVIKGKILPSKYLSYGEKTPHPADTTFSDYKKTFNIINENYITNLLNNGNMTSGKIIDANGNEIEYTSGNFTNNYLLIRKGESIILNFATYLTIPIYDLNKKFKTNIVITDEEVPYIYTATEDCYVRFNVYNKDKNNAMVIKGKELPSSFIPYGKYVMKNSSNNRFNNVLSGNYLFAGDSICAGAGATEGGGYAKLIANKNKDMTYKNISVSGAILCRRTSDDTGSTVLEQIETEISLNNSYNHIVLEGGINDIWNMDKYPLGTFDKYNRNSILDENTICGAFESIIRKSKNAWNDAIIYYIIPHLMSADIATPVFDKLIEICKKYCVIVIDLRYLSGEDVSIEYVKKKYTLTNGIGDGVHNNDLGYEKFYVKPIINILSNY